MSKIIDVSSRDGDIDWNEFVNDGVTDVIIRLFIGYNKKDSYTRAVACVGRKRRCVYTYVGI